MRSDDAVRPDVAGERPPDGHVGSPAPGAGTGSPGPDAGPGPPAVDAGPRSPAADVHTDAAGTHAHAGAGAMDAHVLIDALAATLDGRAPLRIQRTEAHGEAAVTLVLRPGNGLDLLVIKRAEHERDPWSGHMALPGGRREPQDLDLLATAFRETKEETGIDLQRVGRVLGSLDEVEPGSRRLPSLIISPFVVAVPPATPVAPDTREVDDALWVPVSWLASEPASSQVAIELADGRHRTFPSLQYRDYEIWGLTLRILTQFLELLGAK